MVEGHRAISAQSTAAAGDLQRNGALCGGAVETDGAGGGLQWQQDRQRRRAYCAGGTSPPPTKMWCDGGPSDRPLPDMCDKAAVPRSAARSVGSHARVLPWVAAPRNASQACGNRWMAHEGGTDWERAGCGHADCRYPTARQPVAAGALRRGSRWPQSKHLSWKDKHEALVGVWKWLGAGAASARPGPTQPRPEPPPVRASPCHRKDGAAPGEGPHLAGSLRPQGAAAAPGHLAAPRGLAASGAAPLRRRRPPNLPWWFGPVVLGLGQGPRRHATRRVVPGHAAPGGQGSL